jgi:archaetidylinositol phosphate synthase
MSAARAPTLSAARKARPRTEVVMLALQPIANLGIRLLARTGIDPQTVVWTHTVLGVVAAALVAFADPSTWPWAAALLIGKTVLDNIDGGLARATDRVTVMGRYLDSVLDTIVNGLLLAALAVHGPAGMGILWSAGAYLWLMWMLSLDFNLERRYRALHHPPQASAQAEPDGAPAWALALFRGFYRRVLAPQDAAIERLDQDLFARLYRRPYAPAPEAIKRNWNDLWSTATIVNLGLSTQLLLLAVLLLLGFPFAYVWALWGMAAYVVLVTAWRGVRFRRSLRGPR